MSTSFFSLIGLMGLPVLVAQWIGVITLRHAMRGLAWWLMIVGTSMNTLQALLLPLIYGLVGWRSGPGFAYYLSLRGSLTGSLLFAVGFALHCLQVSRASQRQGELEQLVSAMSEEMDRLRESNSGTSQGRA